MGVTEFEERQEKALKLETEWEKNKTKTFDLCHSHSEPTVCTNLATPEGWEGAKEEKDGVKLAILLCGVLHWQGMSVNNSLEPRGQTAMLLLLKR